MKTLVVYTSQTGFTKKYAEWIAQRTEGELLDLKDAQKKDAGFFDGFDAIVYGGWFMAGKVVNVNWFLDKAAAWKNKKLAVYCVGGSPNDNPDNDTALARILTEDQSAYIKLFYCQGGFNYEKMNGPSRFAMKLFVSSLKKKKDATDEQKAMAEAISKSYDISDIKYTDPIVEYLEN